MLGRLTAGGIIAAALLVAFKPDHSTVDPAAGIASARPTRAPTTMIPKLLTPQLRRPTRPLPRASRTKKRAWRCQQAEESIVEWRRRRLRHYRTKQQFTKDRGQGITPNIQQTKTHLQLGPGTGSEHTILGDRTRKR